MGRIADRWNACQPPSTDDGETSVQEKGRSTRTGPTFDGRPKPDFTVTRRRLLADVRASVRPYRRRTRSRGRDRDRPRPAESAPAAAAARPPGSARGDTTR